MNPVPDLEARVIRKVAWRLIPFLMVCYLVSFLDRVNVGFAAATMNAQLGFTASMYGFGAGVFFLTYFLFEVPSNLLLARFGARKWIARIMITWGIVSGVMAFIPFLSRVTGQRADHVFYALRALLGAAEAGFFPGIIYYLTLWFPSVYRGRVIGCFMAAIPLSTAIGGPLSGFLLGLDGAGGLAGWQWLFIIEAAPAVVLGIVTYVFLTDRPADARWLAEDERTWLATRLAAEHRARTAVGHLGALQALLNPRVLALAIVYFGSVICSLAITLWLPQIVKGFGVTDMVAGWITAIPYVIGTVGMIAYGRRSDRLQERFGHTTVALALGAAGVALAGCVDQPALKVAAISLGMFGGFASKPVFWTLPTAFLSGAGAAAGIAAINSIGNLAGFVGPSAIGWFKDATGGYMGGLLFVAAFPAIAAVVVRWLGRQHQATPRPLLDPAVSPH
jgi:ACS family tartrate transporter-like MFS transporter